MSLFRLKEWWTMQMLDFEEQLDSNSVCVANLDNNPQESEKIIIGSASGILRIYDPCTDVEDTVVSNSAVTALPEHLLMESNLNNSILQVTAGKFVSGFDRTSLAVLHPRKLSIYNFAIVSGQAEHGNQYGINLVYEHNLRRAAYNMCHGPFGGIKGRDFICVQSLDGALFFYEQENFVFSRFLPSSLLPGPIAYAAASDSIVTVSSCWQLESYKYQVLAVAVDSGTKEEAANVTSGKRVATDWSMNLGEAAIDLCVVETPPCTPCILVLGERNIFCLTEGGFLRFMKRLECKPSCLLTYTVTSEGWVQYLVGTETNTLLLFCDTTLKWSAQVSFVPIAVKTGKFGFVKGLLVCVGDAGELVAAYLGTDPALFGIPRTSNRMANHALRQQEFIRLQRAIKAATAGKNSLSIPGRELLAEELKISFEVASKLDSNSLAHDSTATSDGQVPSITVKIILNAKQPLDDVQVHLYPPSPLAALQSDFSIHSLTGQKEILTTFYLKQKLIPISMQVPVEATFLLSAGVAKSIKTTVRLPISVVAKATSVPKNSTYKITVDSAKSAATLNELFPELINASDGVVYAVGLQIYGNDIPAAGILVSKNTNKYRVQSESFEIIWLFLSELIAQLQRVQGLGPKYSGPLPLAEYFGTVDHHFELRTRKSKLEEILSMRCKQVRAVERRLLSKFRDVTPAPLSHLDGLLELSYRQIITIATSLEEITDALRTACAAVLASTNLVIALVALSTPLRETHIQTLKGAFAADTDFWPECCWEDKVDLSIAHLLQSLSSNGEAQTFSVPNEKLLDTSRLKRHITMLCDRVSRGAFDGADISKEAKPKPVPISRTLEPIAENSNIADLAGNNFDDFDIPAGSVFGDVTKQSRNPLSLNQHDSSDGDDEFTNLGHNEPEQNLLPEPDPELLRAQKHEYLDDASKLLADFVTNSPTATGGFPPLKNNNRRLPELVPGINSQQAF